MTQTLDNIRIVLVEPSHPGNVGAVARAMKTMGLSNLYLVKPRKFPHIEATQRAAGADSVLESATVVDTLIEAVGDCHKVLGTSVRDREVTWPTLNPRQMADKAVGISEQGQSVAVVFGRENSGLTNAELECCEEQIRIPANEAYSSLNLASAVQIIAYELRVRALGVDLSIKTTIKDNEDVSQYDTPSEQRRRPATMSEKDGHLNHLQDTLEQLDFVKSKPPIKLMRKLTKLYNKADLSNEEIQILRGILTATQINLTDKS